MELCVEVNEKPDYEMHFNLQSFMETLQTLDLEHWKVSLSKEREILDKVMKLEQLEKRGEHTYMNYVTTLRKLKRTEQ